VKQGQKLWTRDELLLAVNLYCKLPFGKLHRNNPDIKNLASLLGRTSNAVAFKLVNFASLDPSLQARGIKGAVNSSRLDREVWNDFYSDWELASFESEKLLATVQNSTVEQLNGIDESILPVSGKERERMVKIRINQSFFRLSVLAAYNSTCCITGLQESQLLVAGHIRPWSVDVVNRLNPRNGIAINPLHDRAFETGLMTITPEYKIRISPLLLSNRSSVSNELFNQYEGRTIILPTRFLPDPEFLNYHNNERFRK
jgi:putative restriction endonuclease